MFEVKSLLSIDNNNIFVEICVFAEIKVKHFVNFLVLFI